ncbi:Cas10/Cmr2 second palm domain-containing protein [Streptosporangium sp. NPDC002607]
MYVVVINTAGNQRYIFSSNKRQEIVGASDLITRVDGAWADEALKDAFPGFERKTWRLDTHGAELVVAGAGGITVLVKERDAGRRLVTALTTLALLHAPGLDVCGVVVEYAPGSLAKEMGRVRTELAAVRESRPGPQARFLRLPPVEDCGSSGLPAAVIHREGNEEPRPRSAAAKAKLDAYSGALDRMAEIAWPNRRAMGEVVDRRAMKKIVDRLGLEASWVAVVHADGNGFGAIFKGLDELVADGDDRGYVETLRSVSQAVDECAKKAFRVALCRTANESADGAANGIPGGSSGGIKDGGVGGVTEKAIKRTVRDTADGENAAEDGRAAGGPLAVLPLVIGGDDLTVVCEGEVALLFTRHYLEAFEEETARDPRLAPVLGKLGRESLGAGAGVAIVKRNYPFHFAYDLAEELIDTEAKRVKEWGAALAFAVLLESSAPDLKRIRQAGGAGGSASPYLVGAGSRDDRARGRRWEDLVRRVGALRRHDPASGELLIPRGAAHDLREGLHLGAEVAASRWELLRRRFEGDRERTAALMELTEEPGGLLWIDRETTVTGLPDAMVALQFLKVREQRVLAIGSEAE